MDAPKGPPTGFGKAINDALIPAAALAHLKAAGLLGFALTLTGILLNSAPKGNALALGLHTAGIIVLVISAVLAGMAIFPMKAVRGRGAIFWGDIVTHGSGETYWEKVNTLDQPTLEREYALTNYSFAKVLDSKYSVIRGATCLLLAGAFLAALGRLVD